MRKKNILIILIIIFISSFLVSAEMKNGKFVIKISAVNFSNADSNFKEIYGNSSILPEFTFNYFFNRNLYVMSGFGSMKKNSVITLMGGKDLELLSKQSFFSLAFGFKKTIFGRIESFINSGIVFFNFKEDGLSETISDSALGFRLDLGVIYNINKLFFIDFKLGYLHGTKKYDNNSVKLGGLLSAVGIGIRF